MTDWQSLGGDPCDQLFNSDTSNLSFYSEEFNVTFNCTIKHSIDCFDLTNESTHNSSANYYCEQFGDDNNYNCFWNPISRITGDYCERCRAVCLSETHSLNFIQLFIGIVLLSSCYVPGRLLVTTIASDLAENRSQVSKP